MVSHYPPTQHDWRAQGLIATQTTATTNSTQTHGPDSDGHDSHPGLAQRENSSRGSTLSASSRDSSVDLHDPITDTQCFCTSIAMKKHLTFADSRKEKG
jgi:hypothetical protein